MPPWVNRFCTSDLNPLNNEANLKGIFSQLAETASELVWVHAVSLGETRTAAMLLKALRLQYPALRLLLTHGTATGREEGRGAAQIYRPARRHPGSPGTARRQSSGFSATSSRA